MHRDPPRRRVVGGDRWQPHAIERGRLDHGVVRHVEEHQLVADRERAIEAVVADHVAGQAGHAAEPVGVRPVAGLAGADDHRAVRHLEHIGHVRGRRGVEDRDVHAVVHHVEHAGDQHAGAERDRLAGLEVDLDVPLAAELVDQPDQAVAVVVGARDVVSAAEVDPVHLRDVLAELELERRERALERVAVDLAQGVEVQAVDAVEVLGREVLARRAQPRARPGGIVERDVDLLVLVVDPEAARDRAPGAPRLLDRGAVALPLPGRVEHDVIGQRDQLADLAVGVRRGVGVDFAAELLARQPGLGDRARGRAAEVAPDQRERRPLGEALEREQDRAPRARCWISARISRLASSAPRSVTKHGVSSSETSIARATSAPSAASALMLI